MVSPLAIRRFARRCRRRGVALLAVAAVGSAIAAHHSGVSMADMHHDGIANAAMELCLGVFVAIGTAVAAVGIALLPLGRRRPPPELRAAGLSGARSRPEPRARPGPALLSLLCVSRR
jgi:peptidoglycan/LPS O-acetylase OafA/YrhL